MDLGDEQFPIVFVTKELFFSPNMIGLGAFAKEDLKHFFVLEIYFAINLDLEKS